jgi:hypothetical protein
MNLKQASQELFRRSPDEIFPDLQSLHTHTIAEKQRSRDRWIEPTALRPRLVDGSRLALQVSHNEQAVLNDWSFTQLCTHAGVSKDTVNRLSASTASQVLRETLPDGKKPLQVFTEGDVVRSIHGHIYTRLYNCDLLSMIREFATDFGPPPVSPINGATGLYCGEQDLFVFLIDPTGWVEINGEAFAPGFYAWNSEVGKRSVGGAAFWFQSICQNHLVWDATEVVEVSRKHTGKVGEALGDVRRMIEQLVEKRDARRDGFVATIKKAMETTVGQDAEEALKMLTRAGVTRQLAKRAVEEHDFEKGRFSIFSVVDTLTRMAREHRNAGDRVTADQQASALLALV